MMIGSPIYNTGVSERRPKGKTDAVRISRSRKVDPVAGHLLGHSPICTAPGPRRLVQMVEDIPELGKVACTPAVVYRTDGKRWLLRERVIVNTALRGSGL